MPFLKIKSWVTISNGIVFTVLTWTLGWPTEHSNHRLIYYVKNERKKKKEWTPVKGHLNTPTGGQSLWLWGAVWEAIPCQPWRQMDAVTSTAECGRVSDTPRAWQLVRKSRLCHSQTRVKGTKALGMGVRALDYTAHDRCPSLYTWGSEGLTCPGTPPTSMYLRMTLNFCSLCLCLLNVEVTGANHHTAYVLLGIKSRAFGNDREVLYLLSHTFKLLPRH